MALPALNNATTIGNLSLDDKSSIITSLVRSGKLQLANYGAINFNQNVTVAGSETTATKESSGISSAVGQTMIRMLEQIRDSVIDLNTNIINYLEDSKIERQVAQNLLEAQQETNNIKAREAEENKYDFDRPFSRVLNNLDEIHVTLGKIYEKIGGGQSQSFGENAANILGSGVFSTIIRGLFSRLGSALGMFARGIPYLAAAYVLSKLPWETIANRGREMLQENGGVAGLVENVQNLFSGDFTESGENQESTTSPQTTSSETTSSTNSSSPNNLSASRINRNSTESGNDQPTNQQRNSGIQQPDSRTATPARFEPTSSRNIASEQDLSGLNFVKHDGIPLKVEKQILKSLAQRLQHIRKKLGGKTLTITSGYRTPEYNKKVGGAKNSQHMQRKAVDVAINNMSERDKKSFVSAAVQAGIGGIGFYDTFIHIDIRNRSNGRIFRWGNIPKWALDIINNPNTYTLEDEQGASDTHRENGENTPTTTPSSTQEQQNQNTADRLSPTPETSDNTATPESGSNYEPEEEEEEEEQNESARRETTQQSRQPNAQNNETASRETSNGNAQEAFDFFSKYWTKEQAAAIVGNLQHESANSFDPHKRQIGGGPGYGIAQWEPPRQRQFKQVMGKDIKDSSFREQLEFVQWELQNTHKRAGNALKETNNIKDATLAVRAYYETPGGNNDPNTPHTSDSQRIRFAESAVRGTTGEQSSDLAQSDQQTNAQPNVEQTNRNQSESFTDSIVQSVRQAAESIRNVTEEPQAIKSFVGNVGELLGFDSSRLRPLPENNLVSLDQRQTEEAETLRQARNNIENASQERERTAQQSAQQPQPILNVNNTGTNRTDDNGINPTPNSLDTRDPLIMQLQRWTSVTTRAIV